MWGVTEGEPCVRGELRGCEWWRCLPIAESGYSTRHLPRLSCAAGREHRSVILLSFWEGKVAAGTAQADGSAQLCGGGAGGGGRAAQLCALRAGRQRPPAVLPAPEGGPGPAHWLRPARHLPVPRQGQDCLTHCQHIVMTPLYRHRFGHMQRRRPWQVYRHSHWHAARLVCSIHARHNMSTKWHLQMTHQIGVPIGVLIWSTKMRHDMRVHELGSRLCSSIISANWAHQSCPSNSALH